MILFWDYRENEDQTEDEGGGEGRGPSPGNGAVSRLIRQAGCLWVPLLNSRLVCVCGLFESDGGRD
jgi:hypothetical protein